MFTKLFNAEHYQFITDFHIFEKSSTSSQSEGSMFSSLMNMETSSPTARGENFQIRIKIFQKVYGGVHILLLCQNKAAQASFNRLRDNSDLTVCFVTILRSRECLSKVLRTTKDFVIVQESKERFRQFMSISA